MPRPRIPERRSRILDVARELTLEKGWRATTVADVAERAGIGKGAVYLEFSDKPAIVEAMILRSMQGLTQHVHERIAGTGAVVTLPMLYEFAVDALLGDPLMRAFYLGDEAVLGDHVRAVSDDRYRLRFTWLHNHIRALQDLGMISTAIPADTLVRVLSTFTIGLLHTPDALGAITDDQLRDTVALFAAFVDRSVMTDVVVDPDTARAAQSALVDTLTGQLDQLEGQR